MYIAAAKESCVTYHYHILTAESVLGTCIAYLANSDTTDKWWYWPDTDTDTRIDAALLGSTKVD